MGPPDKQRAATQQTFVGLQDVLETYSRHVLKTSSTRLQRNNFSSSKTSWRRLANTFWRRLQDVLWDVFKTSSRCIWKMPPARGFEDVLEDEKLLRWRSLEDVLKACLEDALKTCLEDVLKMSWRERKCLLGISIFNHSLPASFK